MKICISATIHVPVQCNKSCKNSYQVLQVTRFNEIEGLYDIYMYVIITWYQAVRNKLFFFVVGLLLVLLTCNNTDDNKPMVIL